MTCPHCKKETSGILRMCQNCNADLEQYISERNKAMEGTGDPDLGSGFRLETLILKAGPAGGLLLMLFSVVWFYEGYKEGMIYYYPPAMFLIGLYGLIAGLSAMKKRLDLRKKKKSGKLID